jgi:uncharacterized membrane protein YkoI
MKLKIAFIFISTVGLPLLACSSSSSTPSTPSELSEADARSKAVTWVPGTAGAVERIETADEHRWGVTVAMSAGSEAVVELERADGQLDEISAKKGPFDYDLPVPGPGIATYATARAAALAAKQGLIEAWEINLVNNVWEIYVRTSTNQLWEIKLNAQTAAVTSSEEKDAVD